MEQDQSKTEGGATVRSSDWLEGQPLTVLTGDSERLLRSTVPDESIDCAVTSPPYFKQRDYGYDGQIGHEEIPEQYAYGLATLFDKVACCLKPTGTLWLNIADTYVGGELAGIPWMVVRMMRSHSEWRVRSEVCWSKPNPMPESVKNRPSRSHEWLFMLTKEDDYYYDAEAVKEPASDNPVTRARNNRADKGLVGAMALHGTKYGQSGNGGWKRKGIETRNRRTVWNIAVASCPVGYHGATFPKALAELCIKASCPVGGIVLDPFAGSGTTGEAALQNNRRAILIEKNPDYVQLINKRCSDARGLPLAL